MKITAKDILKHHPCAPWAEKRLKKFLGEGKTLLQIAQMKDIAIDNRIWCITKFLPDALNREFAIWCARQCKTDCKEITEYIDVIEKYYKGQATKEELKTADRAADSAAYEAANRAAYCAAYEAAYCAAYGAADGAADRAAYEAAYRAADMQMRQKQIKKLTKIVEKLEEDL